jgi:DNA-binding SARP family transcriptional activator
MEIGGEDLAPDLPGRQARLLVAYLVINRERGVTRDEVIDALWPEAPPQSPEAGLSTLLARLRPVVGEGVLTGRAQLSLELGPQPWIDIEVARRRGAEAQAAIGEGRPAEARAAAEEALALISARLLPDLDRQWLDECQRHLEELRTSLLETFVTAHLAAGGPNLTEAERAARELIEREVYRESGYRLLMEVHAARGNVAEALRVFEDLRVLLREELGVAPSGQLMALHERMLREGDLPVAVQAGGGASGAEAPEATGAPELPAIAPPSPPSAIRHAPFVGRERELDWLRDRWDAAHAGESHVTLLGGEPGIGKTRLTMKFAHDVYTAGASVLYGRCDEEALIPYQPFAEVLRRCVKCCSPDRLALDEGMEREAEQLGRLVPELRPPAAGRAGALLEGDENERYLLFEGVAALLERLSRARPVLLVLEDLHWSDRPTLQLLRHLIRRLEGPGLMVLGTYRDAEVDSLHPFGELLADLRRDHVVACAALPGFDLPETAELVSAEGGDARSSSFIERLRHETDGNPFFIGEVIRALREAGLLAGEVSEHALQRTGIPVGVREVILRRLARLGEGPAEALAAASVMGRTFDVKVLARVLDRSVDDVLKHLEEAVDGRLVGECDEVDRFSFVHALVRQTLYRCEMTSRRVRMHRRIAEVLESDERTSPSELAHHFFEARHIVGGEKAALYSVEAAEQAAGSLAYEEAASDYRRALDALAEHGPAADERRCDILLALGRMQWRGGDEGARETFSEAAESARRRGEPQQLARAALGFSGRYYEAGLEDETAIDLLREALRALGSEDSSLRAKMMGRLAEALQFRDSDEDRVPLAHEAVEMARRIGDVDALVTALQGRHAALLHAEHLNERLRDSEELVELAERIGRRELVALGLHWRLYDLFELGDMAAADEELERLQVIADALRQPLYRHFAASWRVKWAELSGRLRDAERISHEAFALGEQAQARHAQSLFAGHLFMLARDRGDLADLVPVIEPLVEHHPGVAVYRICVVDAYLAAGDEDEARRLYRELARDDFAQVSGGFFWLGEMCLLAEACAPLGDRDTAPALYERLRPYAAYNAQLGLGGALGFVDRFLALLAMTFASYDVAADHFESALAAGRSIGATTFTAQTQRDYGELLIARGRPGDADRARELLSDALATAEATGMSGVAERVATLARALGPADAGGQAR